MIRRRVMIIPKDEPVMYSLRNQNCNADFYQLTGLFFGTTTVNGYLKDWTITFTGINTGTWYLYPFGQTNSNNGIYARDYPGGINIFIGSYNMIHGRNMHGQYSSVVLTHLKNSYAITGYFTDGSVETINQSAPWQHQQSELVVGGHNGVPSLVGVIRDFTIYNRILTTNEINTYLGL